MSPAYHRAVEHRQWRKGQSLVVLVALLAVSAGADAEDVLRPFKQDGKWGYRDSRGNVVVAPNYDEARSFCCGLAAVNVGARMPFMSGPPGKTGGKWGYIDACGTVVSCLIQS